MKSFFKAVLAVFAVFASAHAAGGVIKVGATPVPHAQILEFAKPLLAKEGYSLKIVIFNDYVIPNLSVSDGELDANFFQHLPYLNDFNRNKGTDLVKTIAVHLEPMGVYSKKLKDLKNLPVGASVSLPNDPTNESRAFDVLAKEGLVELKSVTLKTPLDVTKNEKKLKFKELDAAQLPRTLDDVEISVINTNFALNAGLSPLKDALAIESKDSPYANIIAVKKGNETSAKIKALNKVLTSDEVRKFILENYKGAIIPAF
ncbi:MAG: MetQ/NlpA family ABC transporter substrate-binding protein [Helicobacteraceae bacterium]